jgi:hypothetical protein
VYRQERGAKLGHALDALGHGVADVVQLEVDEHLLAATDQRLGKA